ncbi:ABC transporter ATP-binding protein [Nocardia sp. NBC_01730]|uniref:ABC transporter ATP-binding protein n=1 Tax=Nocardia sp. NBC_01730 TaxID=2975998 RepID=UPI002E0F64A2|nr:ABC transporter ATP-binding protein [Nocardia sp. NBC_01730]
MTATRTVPTVVGAAAITTTGLTKTYPGAAVDAVDRLDLSIPPGVVYCLLGRNGAGKTTTIRMLTTLLSPSSGTAEVLGIPLHEVRTLRPLIGVALQEVALDPWLNAREQLDLGLAMAGWPRAERRPRVAALVEQFGLGDFQNRRIGSLSGGMRRRVDVALAVSHDPLLLFLDEPSSGLDIEGKEEVWRVIAQLRSAGRTVVLTTHDMEEAVALADQVGIIKAGTLVASGPADDLTRAHGARAVVTADSAIAPNVTGELQAAGFTVADSAGGARVLTIELPAANAAHLGRLTEALSRNDLGAAEVRVETTSLRDAFLEATR